MTSAPGWAWAAAGCAIGCLLAIDLVASRRQPGMSRSVLLSAAWVGAGIGFGLVITLRQGADASQQYFAAYLTDSQGLAVMLSFIGAKMILAGGARLDRGELRHDHRDHRERGPPKHAQETLRHRLRRRPGPRPSRCEAVSRMIDLSQLDVSSPLSYLVAVLIPAPDALLPVLPSETAVIALGVATAGHADPRIAVLLTLAACGAFIGDNLAYLLGRRFGPVAERRFFSSGRGARSRAWAEHALDRFGTRIIIVCRFIPGGRTAVTLTCGMIGYRRRSFVVATACAGVIWAVYAFFIGRLGGKAFEGMPWMGLMLALGVALVLSIRVEVLRRARPWRLLPWSGPAVPQARPGRGLPQWQPVPAPVALRPPAPGHTHRADLQAPARTRSPQPLIG